MKLDNEEQRALLINLINIAPVSGQFGAVRDELHKIDELLKVIEKAGVTSHDSREVQG